MTRPAQSKRAPSYHTGEPFFFARIMPEIALILSATPIQTGPGVFKTCWFLDLKYGNRLTDITNGSYDHCLEQKRHWQSVIDRGEIEALIPSCCPPLSTEPQNTMSNNEHTDKIVMTEAQAIKWVKQHNDSDDLDQAQLEAAFTAIFERPPDQQDHEEGLWSHVCAAVI